MVKVDKDPLLAVHKDILNEGSTSASYAIGYVDDNSQVQTSKRVKYKSVNSIVYSEGTLGSQAKEPKSNKRKSKASEGVSTQDRSSSVPTNVNQESSPYHLGNWSQIKLGSQPIMKEKNSPECL